MRALPIDTADPTSLAKTLVADIPLDDICRNPELMNDFLAEMFLAVSKASGREVRHQRQAEGIAAAKARGVKFGPKASPLPDNFEQARRAWRRGDLNVAEAAQMCGMAKTTFHNAVRRVEKAQQSICAAG